MRRSLVAMLIMGVPGLAQATIPFMAEVPNSGGERCNTCHISGGGSPRNDFGADFWRLGRDWSALSQEDSDGDGFSNGVELGDPEGRWQRGEEPPGPFVSHPGDADDVPEGEPVLDGGTPSSDGGADTDDAGAAVDAGSPIEPDDAVGCSCEAVDRSTWMLFGGVLVIGIALARRKGPRDRDR